MIKGETKMNWRYKAQHVMRMTIAVALTFVLIASTQSDVQGQDEDRGIAVGEKAPDFKLKDQAGNDVELSKLLEDQNVALVFYRSASW